MGMATINTSEITNDSFLGSPLIAPLVAIAAETRRWIPRSIATSTSLDRS